MRALHLALACATAVGSTAASLSGDNLYSAEPHRFVEIQDGAVHMAVTGLVAATPGQVWSLLTEYASLPSYMPCIDSSLVIGRTDTSCVVRQVVTTRIMLQWTFRLDLEFVPDRASQRLCFRQVRGSLRGYEGHWEIAPDPSGSTTVRYEARARLRRPVPGFVAAHIVRRHMDRMFAALAGELERRGRRVEAPNRSPGAGG